MRKPQSRKTIVKRKPTKIKCSRGMVKEHTAATKKTKTTSVKKTVVKKTKKNVTVKKKSTPLRPKTKRNKKSSTEMLYPGFPGQPKPKK